jgi:hypothetical protein
MKPEKEDKYVSEYTRFLKNSRGVTDDFQTWMQDLHGSAVKKKKKRDKNKPSAEEETE